jgi:Glycosyl hydrolase family 26
MTTSRHHGRRTRPVTASVLAVLVTATLLACTGSKPTPTPTPSGGSATTSSEGRVPTPATGAYLGTHFGGTDEARKTALTALEAKIGRKFAIDHVYYRWSDTFPSAYDTWTIAQGRTLFLNWSSKADNGPPVKWADIAAGGQDQVIDARARAIAALGVPVFMGFTHEPGGLVGTGRSKSGTTDDYRAAWRHVVERFRQAGTTNVTWVWTLTSYQFRNADVTPLYPGDDVIDWVGADGYANISCPWLKVGGTPFDQIFAAASTFAAAHEKPLMIAEFNVGEDPSNPAFKADWFEAAVTAVAKDPTIKALVSFNSQESCAAVVDTSAQSVDGFAAMAESPQLKALPPVPSTDVPAGGPTSGPTGQ